MISEKTFTPSSARRGRPRTRVEVEDVLRLHLPSLLEAGYAVPGDVVSTRLAGEVDDRSEVAFRIVVDLKERRGQALIFPDVGRCYTVEITSDPQPFGGRRWWWICPVTGRAAATLYLPPGATRFASRQAHGLGYRTQRLDAAGRAHERVAKGLREAAG